jgi:hypothetical protein
LALLSPGVNDPVAKLGPNTPEADAVPFTALTVATLLNSESVYWNGRIELPNDTVKVVGPALAPGSTKIAAT